MPNPWEMNWGNSSAPAAPAQSPGGGITIGTPRGPAPPSGYRYNGSNLEAIPGGPADPAPPNIGVTDVHGEDYLKTLDPGTGAMVKALADGRKAFPTGAGLKAPYWQEMLQRVANYDPGFDEVNYTGRAGTRRDFTSGKAANNIRALNTAIGHLGHLEEQIGGTASHGGFPLATTVNALENAYLRSSGDQGPTNFDTTVSALAGELTAVYRGSGGAEADIQRYIQQLTPNASKEQKTGAIRNIVGLLKSRLDALNDQYRQGMGTTSQQLQLLDPQSQLIVQHLGGFDAAGSPENQQPPPAVGPGGSQSGPSPVPPGGGDGGITGSANLASMYQGDNAGGDTLAPAGDMKQINDPKLTGLMGEYLHRLGSGQSAGEIIKWATAAGVPMTGVMAKSIADQVAYRRQHPDVLLSNYNISAFDDRYVPTTLGNRVARAAADSAPGAAVLSYGNALTGDNADSLIGMAGGNAEQARVAFADAQRQHPVASTLGTIGGGVNAALVNEAALARLGLGAGVARSALADTAYGAETGAGATDYGPDGSPSTAADRLKGAGLGALYGLGGSIAGQGVARGLASTVSPTGGKLSDLYAAGVRPTPGQRFAESGVAGRMLNATEEHLSSIPIVGSAIRGARQNARDQFQTGAFNSALGEIGTQLPKGMRATDAHAFTQKAFDAAYDNARTGMQILPDQQLASDIQNLGGQVGNLAQPSAQRFGQIVQNVVLRRAGQQIDGTAYKAIQADLGKVIRGIRKSPSGDHELADALGDLQGILDSAARRHSPPDAVQAMDAADRGYAQFVQIENASTRGGAAKEPGTFSPTDYAAAVKGGGTRVRGKAYNQGQALNQGYAQQGLSLNDRIPNSGTPERQMAGLAAAGGAGYLDPGTLGVLGVLGTLYAPGMRKVLTGALAPRGPQAKALAQAIRQRARLAGAAGTALASQEANPGQ